MTNRSHVAVVASLALGLTACLDAPDEVGQGQRGESRIDLEPSVVIGESDGDPDYLFGDIRAVATGDDGFIYVGDRIGATVRAFSSEGEFLGEIAQEGEGPGEIYGWPADLSLDPDGRLYIRDASRITILGRSMGSAVADSLIDIWAGQGLGNLGYATSRVTDEGSYYYPNGSYRPDERARFFYPILRDGVFTEDTLAVPYHPGMEARRTAFFPVGPGGGGRMVDGLSHVPFFPLPTWSITPRGTVLSAGGQTAQLYETDLAGDTVRVITLGGDPARPISATERADSLGALRTRIDSLPVPITDIVNLGAGVADLELPDLLPQVLNVHVGSTGVIWVERWPPVGSGDARFYTVLDSAGVQMGDVSLQAPLLAEPSPYFSRGHVVGVVQDSTTGVHSLVLFTLPESLVR